jgi:thioredoxin
MTPDELIEKFAGEEEEKKKSAKISPDKAGKLSIVSAVVGIVINLASDAIFKEGTTDAMMANVAAGAAVALGVMAAMWGLARAWKCPGRDAMILAGTGLVMNGILIVVGFVTLPIPGKLDMGPENVSAKQMSVSSKNVSSNQISASPASAKGGRLIVQDWTAGNVIEITDKNFKDAVNNSSMPVLVDFWAPWCGPCRTMGPIIEDIAAKYKGRVKVCKLNVDTGKETSSSFQVSGIPTIILFKKGKIIQRWTGVTEDRYICAVIDKQL